MSAFKKKFCPAFLYVVTAVIVKMNFSLESIEEPVRGFTGIGCGMAQRKIKRGHHIIRIIVR